MASYLCTSSLFIACELDKVGPALDLAHNWINRRIEEEDHCGVSISKVPGPDHGLYLYEAEAFSPDNCAELIVLLMDFLGISEPIAFTWSETCSKLRPGAFAGGGCIVWPDKEPSFIHPIRIMNALVGTQDDSI